MNKKGQAVLEFLITYGWAILVVLAAIGALFYFGVLTGGPVETDYCYTAPTLETNDICHNYVSSNCGKYLYKCDSGKEYMCIQNVIREEC